MREVSEAKSLAESAEDEAKAIAGQLTRAGDDVKEARKRFVRQRRLAWALGIVVFLLVGAAAFLAAVGGSRQVVAVVGVAAALFGSVSAAAVQLTRVSGQAEDIVSAGRAGMGFLSRVSGRSAGMAAQAAALTEQKLTEKQVAASEKATRLRAAAERAEVAAKKDPVGTVLGQLSSVTEYREQLSLVAHTRKLFDDLNDTFAHPANGAAKRFVIVIDDLDRCAAESVVRCSRRCTLACSTTRCSSWSSPVRTPAGSPGPCRSVTASCWESRIARDRTTTWRRSSRSRKFRP